MKLKLGLSEVECTFLLDSGSDISIIKASKVKSDQIYYPSENCNIKGVGEGTITSLGSTHTCLHIEGEKINQSFQIVSNGFPIPTDGILGRDFMIQYKCKVDYELWMLFILNRNEELTVPIQDNLNGAIFLPQRCEIIRRIPSLTQCQEDSVVCSEEIHPGIFMGNTIVNSQNPYVKLVNTLEVPVLIENITPTTLPLKNFYVHTSTRNTIPQSRAKILADNIKIDNANPNLKNKLQKLLNEYNDIFHLPGDRLSTNNFYEQKINLEDKQPVYIANYKQIHAHVPEIKNQVNNLLENGIIEPSVSHYNSPILLVPKRTQNGQKWRLVVDFRQLNKKLLPDKFPLPRIDAILDQLGRAKYFTTLDLMSGFHQIPLEEHSKKYTAFSTSTGHYHFKRLPFGLNISPNSFQRMMTIALAGLTPECAFVYIDDIVVIGCSENHHLGNLRIVFERLRKYNLKLNPEKCCFFKQEVTYLGHKITDKGILPDDSKYDVIQKYPVPKNADEVRRYVAFCNYYRKFIQNFSEIAQPLNKLLRKNTLFEWSDECHQSFELLKTKLLQPQILQYPDFQKEFILTTDASSTACGAVLSQKYNEVELPIAFASRTFTKGELNKAIIEKELAAIHWAIEYFKPHLLGRKFRVKTDHRPLVYLFGMKKPSNKLQRIRLDLEEYDFEIEYVKGKQNVIADALSRINITSAELKTINVITRSMTKKKNPEEDKVSILQPDKLRMFNALSFEEVLNLPKLEFGIINELNSVICTPKIKNKTSKKDLLLVRGIHLNNKGNDALVHLFQSIEKDAIKLNLNQLALSTDDEIFEFITAEALKKDSKYIHEKY